MVIGRRAPVRRWASYISHTSPLYLVARLCDDGRALAHAVEDQPRAELRGLSAAQLEEGGALAHGDRLEGRALEHLGWGEREGEGEGEG